MEFKPTTVTARSTDIHVSSSHIIAPDKVLFLTRNCSYHISPRKHMMWYSLEVPCPWTDCMDTHAHLSLHCSYVTYMQQHGHHDTLVLGISQHFIVDHRFCKTDWLPINNRLANWRKYINSYFSSLPGTYSWLQINKRGIQIIFILFLHENICCGYSLEVPPWGASSEYPQHMFSWRKISVLLGWLFQLVDYKKSFRSLVKRGKSDWGLIIIDHQWQHYDTQIKFCHSKWYWLTPWKEALFRKNIHIHLSSAKWKCAFRAVKVKVNLGIHTDW